MKMLVLSKYESLQGMDQKTLNLYKKKDPFLAGGAKNEKSAKLEDKLDKRMESCLLLVLLICVLLLVENQAFVISSQRPFSSSSRTFTCQTILEGQSSAADSSSTSVDPESSLSDDGRLSADSIYFDLEIQKHPIGRLVFHLTNPSPLPLHAENVIQLVKGSRKGIDPMAHYVGCEFEYSPSTIEEEGNNRGGGGGGRYLWGHTLKGRGRNAIGRADQTLIDQQNQLIHTHSCYGGQYYGDKYNNNNSDQDDDPGVVLTVPIKGPGHGTSKISIVRVGESPNEWQERLLINSGVIGRLDPSCLEVLHTMARQRIGPPTVAGAGVYMDESNNAIDNQKAN
eukprot:scaffold1069_cov143-Cylindrotheca_fusiformis.AAC.6